MTCKANFLLLFSLIFGTLSSQSEVRTEQLSMIRGMHDALVIDIPYPKQSFAEKEWRDFVAKYGKAEKVRKTNEWLLQSANLVNYPDIDIINIYAEAAEQDSTIRFATWFEADTTFLSPEETPEAWQSAITMMEDFSVKVILDLTLMELDDEQKLLDKLQSELDRLENNHTKYVETIDRAHQDIQTAESNIVENTKDQEALTVDMQQYTNLENDPDAQKALAKLEKDMRKLKKQNLNYHNSIASNQERIADNEANIEQNLADQETKKQEITAQEEVVAEVRNRLDEIRALGAGGEG